MSTNTKTVLKGFDYMHCDDFAKYLSDMAAKGWHFKEWGIGLKFEKGEPEDTTYAVEVFTKASENDMRPEPNTQEFAEYCETAGWKLVDAKQKFCIFKKVDADAVELFTPEERVANAFKGTVSGSALILLGLYAINALLQWINVISFFDSRIFSSSFWFSFSVWNVMFIGQLCTFLYAFWKKRKLIKDIKDGKEIYIGNRNDGKFHIGMRDIYLVLVVFLLLSYLFMVGKTELVLLNVFIIVATLVFAAVLAKIRPDSNTNVIIQVVFSFALIFVIFVATMSVFYEDDDVQLTQDELPLQVSDYREYAEEIEDIDILQERNFLGSSASYYIFSEDSVYYDIYKSEHTWILDRIWAEEIDAKYNINGTDCAAEWEAQQAFRNKIGIYYVRYENTIFILNENDGVYLTQDQINIIRDKLDLR